MRILYIDHQRMRDVVASESSEETSRTQADTFEKLAERGRFDEEGGELSGEDWADSLWWAYLK